MLQVITRIPAKINLTLSVGPRRSDGFHDLATVFHAVTLYDEVRASAGEGLALTMSGPYGDAVPADDSNLAVRAARALARRARVPANVRLDVRKSIPVAAGLAGGSADAAGTLLVCDQLWGLGLPDAALMSIAASLGSDVPFAMTGGTALGGGRGERLRPLSVDGVLHWVLAVADGELSTPEVYARLDELRADAVVPDPAVDDQVLVALSEGDPVALGRTLHNDMQAAAVALRPSLEQTLAAGRELGSLGGIVCGSGPTCAFLARDAAHAGELADGLSASGTCAAVHPVTGPAPTGD